jgi:trimeric autotransporter adhesin
MQINKKLTTIAITALLLLSVLALALPANAVIATATASPATGIVGSRTLLVVSGASPGGQVQTYWENLAGIQLGNQTTFADATGAVSIVVTIPDATGGVHSLIVRDVSTGATAGTTFTVTSAIVLAPTRGIPADIVQVNGTGYGASKNITITFNGVDVTSARTTSTATGNFTGTFAVPTIAYGTYNVVATDNSTSPISATTTFTVGASVTISPTSGPAGTIVTITGRGFTKTAGLNVLLSTGTIPLLNLTSMKTLADGTFSGTFVVPTGLTINTRYTVTATDGTINGTTSGATGGFLFNGNTGITVTPTSASPGGAVTVTGSNFTAIAGTVVTIRFGATAAGTFNIATFTTNATGGFSGAVTIPQLPTGAGYFINATDANQLNATTPFTVAITALFLTPNVGPVGTLVTVTGFGFTGSVANVTLGNTILNLNVGVPAILGGTTTFIVPTMAVGAYTVTVTDDNRLTASATFTVNATSTLTVSPTTAPVGISNVALTVRNFYPNVVVNFFIANSTNSYALTTSPAAPTTNASSVATATFTVPALDLGVYTIIANESNGGNFPSGDFNATATFTIGAATVIVNPRSTTYAQGDIVSFNVQSTFQDTSAVITIVDPTGYAAVTIPLDTWTTGTTLQTVPYLVTAFQLPNDAPLGTWNWTTTIAGTKLSGNFTVQIGGSIAITNINTKLDNLNATLLGIGANVTSIKGTEATIQTNTGVIQTTLAAINATIIAINGNTATLSTSLGTVTTTINSMNSAVSTLSGTVSGLSGSITSINSGIATIQTTLGTVNTKLDSINAVLGAVAGQNAEINTTLGTLTTSLASIGTTVTSINGNVATIKTDLGTLSGTVTSVTDAGIATIQTDLGTMQTSIGNLQTDVTSTKSNTSSLSPLIIVAIVLALVAAIAAIASIVLMRRKIAG